MDFVVDADAKDLRRSPHVDQALDGRDLTSSPLGRDNPVAVGADARSVEQYG